jgi:hypothetical protein
MAENWTIMVYISADDVLANFAIESLQQLRNAAIKSRKMGGDRIAVVAAFDANQHEPACIYFFNGEDPNSDPTSRMSEIGITEMKKLTQFRCNPVDMTLPETLTEFINYASANSKTERYCLILWGHGTELLLDDERRLAALATITPAAGPVAATKPKIVEALAMNGSVRRYLTPRNLKKALEDTNLAKADKHLDIIGIDACSMSMIEVASELNGLVDFMVASQGDVPDQSFPYENILETLAAENTGDVRKLCEMIPKLYQQSFQNYIATPANGMREITLSSLDLRKIGKITSPLKKLSAALLGSISDKYIRDAILAARKKSQGFVFGIFVDLFDYCTQLKEELVARSITNDAITSACREIRDAIKLGGSSCLIANETSGKKEDQCHGLSIYFPYRVDDPTDEVEELLAKGGTRRPLKERSARIEELEADFELLDRFKQTEWLQFIKEGWSLILAEQVPPLELDKHYSGEQCTANLFALYQGQRKAEVAKAA